MNETVVGKGGDFVVTQPVKKPEVEQIGKEVGEKVFDTIVGGATTQEVFDPKFANPRERWAPPTSVAKVVHKYSGDTK